MRTDGVNFEVFNKNSGLSGNVVRALYEDRNKNIWIGTESGLDLYDGKNIMEIISSETHGISVVTSISEDSAGNILVGTDNSGLFMVSIGSDTIIASFDQDDGLLSNCILDIQIDKFNRYWLALDLGINMLNPLPDNSPIGIAPVIEGLHLIGDVITCSAMDPSGNIWFGGLNRGMFMIQNPPGQRILQKEIPEEMDFLTNETIWDILWSDSSTCWVATESQGLLKLEAGSPIRRITNRNGLPTNQIYRIFMDRDRSLWMATMGNGILRYDGDIFISYGLNPDRSGIDVLDIIEVEPDQLLIITDEGLYWVESAESFEPIINKLHIRDFPYESALTSATISRDGKIWLGTDRGLYTLKDQEVLYSEYNGSLSSTKIRTLYTDNMDRLWVGTNYGFNICTDSGVYLRTSEFGLINDEIQAIFQDSKNHIWIGTMKGLVRISDHYRDFDEEEGLDHLIVNSIIEASDGDILIGTFGGGIYKLHELGDSVEIVQIPGNYLLSSKYIYAFLWEDNSTLIAVNETGFDRVSIDGDSILQVVHYDVDDGFCSGSNNLNSICQASSGSIWFGTSKSLISYKPDLDVADSIVPVVYITDVKIGQQETNWKGETEVNKWYHLPSDLELTSNQNDIIFDLTAIYFRNTKDLGFSYLIDGISSTWSSYSTNRSISFQGLPPGDYRLFVKARTNRNRESKAISYSFKIKPPFWLTGWFIIVSVVALTMLILGIIRLRVRALQKEQIHLKRIVDLRTWEITQQKEQIMEQRDVLAKQQTEITDSIKYAKHIQQAILPEADLLENCFEDFFILLLPQHIVSGDFYWIGRKNSHLVFTAADCTGHGVPGAFMSMLGISLLNHIVKEKGVVEPGKILNELRANIVNSFHQTDEDGNRSNDGIDIAVCGYDEVRGRLFYAGANNSIIQITRDGNQFRLIEHKPDKMPIGPYHIMDDFNEFEIKIQKGDSLYLYSDGFRDQFGGADNKRFMKRRFKNMLVSNQNLCMPEQKKKFAEILYQWIEEGKKTSADITQTDDVLLMGIRF